jgi:peptide chain release factor 2
MQDRKRLEQSIENDQLVRRSIEDLDTLLELAREGEKVLPDIERDLKTTRELVDKLETAMLLSGPNDYRDAIVTIHPGAGGTESQDWAEMLLRMYLRWAERENFGTVVTDRLEGEGAGIKSVTFEVNGENAYGLLQGESGVHRLVRISPFDANARRHTSFASVFVYPQIDEEIKIEIQDKDLRIDTFRASGAGGQHVNMTDSAVRMTHFPSGIVVQCQNERSQHKNRASAMKVLKSRLFDMRLKETEAKLAQLGGEKRDIAFGSQIRNYVMQPYQLVKDLRTKEQTGDINRVLDGDIDQFIKAYLMKKAAGTLSAATDDTED